MLQDELWEEEIEEFLDRLELRPGDRVLEVGCGLGLDLARLARRVGPNGEVVAVESNPYLAEECATYVKQQGLKRVKVVLGPPPDGLFHAIYCSWKPGSVQPPPLTFRHLLDSVMTRLLPKGLLGVWEHHWDGLSLFPPSPALQTVMAALQERVASPALACARMLADFASSNLLFEQAWPRQKAQAPGSPVYRWAEQYLQEVGPELVAQERLSAEAWEALLGEWEQRRLDPATLVFSPKAMGLIGRAI